MTACTVCGGPMKDLFTGTFCPKDCDRPRAPVPKSSHSFDEMLSLGEGVASLLLRINPECRQDMADDIATGAQITVGRHIAQDRTYVAFATQMTRHHLMLCDWVVKVCKGSIPPVVVVKNRFGGFKLSDIPEWKEP